MADQKEGRASRRIKVSSQKINLHTLSGKKIVKKHCQVVNKMMGPILPVFHLASAKSKKFSQSRQRALIDVRKMQKVFS